MKARSPVSAFAFSLVLSLGLGSSHSYAAPVQWPDNGHWYEAIPGTYSWNEANVAASTSVFNLLPGHLATITSVEENAFIRLLSPTPDGYILGGLQDPAATTVSGGWAWVTGEPWAYTNWQGNEPNDLGDFSEALGPGDEDRLHFFGATGANGWNDYSGEPFNSGYVVEYGTLAAIPEPQTTALLLAGLGLLGFAARRRLK